MGSDHVYVVSVKPTHRGFTMTVKGGTGVVRRVTAIPTLEEAQRRAAVWKRELGARVKVVRS